MGPIRAKSLTTKRINGVSVGDLVTTDKDINLDGVQYSGGVTIKRDLIQLPGTVIGGIDISKAMLTNEDQYIGKRNGNTFYLSFIHSS